MTRRITDRQRLDWLQRNRVEIHDRYHDPVDRWRAFSFSRKIDTCAPTIRAAVDAAIHAERRRRAKK